MDFYERNKLFREWQKSEQARAMLSEENEVCQRLMEESVGYLENVDALEEHSKKNTARMEYAVRGGTHRGPLCPSPVIEYIVGNVKRGKMLKRVTSASRVTHRYAYDKDGRLLYVEVVSELDGMVYWTEYIMEDNNRRLGFTVDCDGLLCAISEEIYKERVLKRYTYLELLPTSPEPLCYNMRTEIYYYNHDGIMEMCDWIQYRPLISGIEKLRFTFQRNDGEIAKVTSDNLIWNLIIGQHR